MLDQVLVWMLQSRRTNSATSPFCRLPPAIDQRPKFHKSPQALPPKRATSTVTSPRLKDSFATVGASSLLPSVQPAR